MDGPEVHAKYVQDFFAIQFPQGDVPIWAVEALATADIHVTTTLTAPTPTVDGEVQTAAEVAPGQKVSESSCEEQADKKAKLVYE